MTYVLLPFRNRSGPLTTIAPSYPREDTEARTDRQRAMCQELADLGMELARAAARRTLRTWAAEEAAAHTQTPVPLRRQAPSRRPPDPGLLFARLSKAVRETIALEASLAVVPATRERRTRAISTPAHSAASRPAQDWPEPDRGVPPPPPAPAPIQAADPPRPKPAPEPTAIPFADILGANAAHVAANGEHDIAPAPLFPSVSIDFETAADRAPEPPSPAIRSHPAWNHHPISQATGPPSVPGRDMSLQGR